MTTILYDHDNNVIAYDSRLTRGSRIASDQHNKLKRNGDLVFIMAGDEADIIECVKTYPGSASREIDPIGFVIKEGVVYGLNYEGAEPIEVECTFSESFGSGGHYAIAALDCGKSAEEAVEVAIKRDNGSGGIVRKYAAS